MREEWLTVKDFSEKAGITTQAIYKKLPTLRPDLVKVIANVKHINISVLKEYELIEVGNSATKVANELPTSEFSEIVNVLDKTIKVLSDQVGLLKNELSQKDNQIEEKDNQIKNLHNLLEQALKNTSEGHFVLAQQQQKILDEPINESIPWYKKIFKK